MLCQRVVMHVVCVAVTVDKPHWQHTYACHSSIDIQKQLLEAVQQLYMVALAHYCSVKIVALSMRV
jgi:hypothetical protein